MLYVETNFRRRHCSKLTMSNMLRSISRAHQLYMIKCEQTVACVQFSCSVLRWMFCLCECFIFIDLLTHIFVYISHVGFVKTLQVNSSIKMRYNKYKCTVVNKLKEVYRANFFILYGQFAICVVIMFPSPAPWKKIILYTVIVQSCFTWSLLKSYPILRYIFLFTLSGVKFHCCKWSKLIQRENEVISWRVETAKFLVRLFGTSVTYVSSKFTCNRRTALFWHYILPYVILIKTWKGLNSFRDFFSFIFWFLKLENQNAQPKKITQ